MTLLSPGYFYPIEYFNMLGGGAYDSQMRRNQENSEGDLPVESHLTHTAIKNKDVS